MCVCAGLRVCAGRFDMILSEPSLRGRSICRFCFVFKYTLVQAWLERAENAAKAKKEVDGYNGNEKKRKRTSIAAPEKRSLEAYFTVQPRSLFDTYRQ